MTLPQLEAALLKAVVDTIKAVGLRAFKATSLFGSNERKPVRSM